MRSRRARLLEQLDGQKTPTLTMFGNRNVGSHALSNLQSGGQLCCDQTFEVSTWYARTNLTDVCRFQGSAPYDIPPPSADLIRAWDAWSHGTTAELVIGSKPMRTRPLAELLGPRMFGSACGNPGAEMDDVGVMWKRYRDSLSRDPDRRMFGDLPELEQAQWRAVAGVYPFTLPVKIPVRQNYSVRLRSDPKALTALLKVLPENIAPRALVWIHLDGLLTREVA
jgi:hypothetical protein